MKNFQFICFCLFLLPLLSPYFGSLDVIAPQWLFLSFLNFFYLIYFFRNPIIIPKSYPFYIFSLFVIQVILSLFYSNNLNVSVVDSTRILILFFTILNIYYILSSGMITFKMISIIISVFLLIEVLYSFVPFLSFIFENDPSVYRQFSSIYQENFFIGFSGNKNITAASIAIKIPFLFYLFNITNKKIFLILSSFFSFAVFSLIFLLKARSVFLSFSFVLFSFIITSLYFKRYRSFLFLPLIVLSFLFVSLLTTKQYNPVLNDIKSINFSAASSSDRFLLWDNAFSYILDHPIIGCGIGNWKIESLPYWNTHLSNYVVPYHAHNDFLEFTTELGLVGGFTYTFFFFSIFISLFSLLYRFRNHFIRFNQIFVVFASFSVYTIDALLNFPHERPRIQIIFAILVSLVLLLNKRKKFA